VLNKKELRMPGEKYWVTFTVNQRSVTLNAPARMSLAEALREELGLTGTHIGCEHGVCGACTVLLDGEPVRSCLIFAVQLEGASITTIEGLAGTDGQLHPVQTAFRECHALQCGFCTPGMVLTIASFLNGDKPVTAQSVREAISGNLCMCTGYQNIVRAALSAAEKTGAASR
jgi:aerobic carbon-monoxide dehydrogenase small subunit